MSQPPNTENQDRRSDRQDIPKWARIYGQNRSLPLVIYSVFFLLLSAALGVPSYLAGKSYQSGHMVLFWICVALCVLAFAVIIYFSLCGQKLIDRIARHFYRIEGEVAVSPAKTAWTPSAGSALVAVVALVLCLFGVAILNEYGFIPGIEGGGESDRDTRYMQPVSAVFGVPILIFLALQMRPAVGWLALLWPGLYGLHAVLIVAGAPIVFTGKWNYLNMLIPTAGYGLLTGLVGHAYSRYALHRLKQAARSGLVDSDLLKESQG